MKLIKLIPLARALLCAAFLARPALAADDPPAPVVPAAPAAPASPVTPAVPAAPAAPTAQGTQGTEGTQGAAANPADETRDAAGQGSSNSFSEPAGAFRFFRGNHGWGHFEGGGGSDIVSVGEKAALRAGDSCPNFVVVLGSADCRGRVYRDAVIVSSDAEINGTIDGDLVLIMSHAHVGSNAVVNGQLVVVGPAPDIEPGAKIERRGTELTSPAVMGAADYVTKGLVWGRPFPPQVRWVWWVALTMFAMTFLITLLFPRPVSNCVATLRARPFACFFAGIGLRLLALLLAVLAACTVILIPAIPFLACIVFFAALLGKAALSVALGQVLVGRDAEPGGPRLLLGFVVGAVLIYFLYMIPLLGLFVFLVVFPTILGAGILSRFGMPRPVRPAAPRRETPVTPGPPPSAPAASPAPAMTAASTGVTPASSDPFFAPPGSTLAVLHASVPDAGGFAVPPSMADPAPTPAPSQPFTPPPSGFPAFTAPPLIPPQTARPPSVAEILSLPRAGFFWRLAATGLDLMLVCAAIHFLVREDWLEFGEERSFLAIWLGYHVGMWMWKGTTLGGSVFGLRLVRANGEALDWRVALMRAFASCVSFLALGLGFFWVAWDPEKQSWHDKIADTVIVKQTRAIALV